MSKQLFIIATLLCLSCLSATAQETVVENIEGSSIEIQCNLRDILYAEQTSVGPYKARSFANPNDAVINYKDRITNMPQCFHDFIAEYVKAGQEVLDGGSNWLSDPTLGEIGSGRYFFPIKVITGSAPFTFPAGSSGDVIQQAAINAFTAIYEEQYNILKSFTPYAFLSLNLDHPEFFWIGNGFNYGCGYNCSYSYYTSGSGTVNYTITLQFILLSSDFDIRNIGVSTYNFRNTTNLANGVLTFNNAIETILSGCQTGSRYDKLLAAHDWLTHHNRYNPYYPSYSQDQIGDTPWSAFSAMEGNNGQQAPVCEGYSRAFKVLCDKMGIPCILMSGIAKTGGNEGGHMWNYVQMENGKWYAVDVTWDDPSMPGNYNSVSGYECHDWFLVGSTTDIEGLPFIESHPEQWQDSYPNKGTYSWDLLSGPVLAPLAWTPEEEDNTGDLNGDGKTDIADAVTILNIMAEGIYSEKADLNNDSKIDIADFVTVLNIMAAGK